MKENPFLAKAGELGGQFMRLDDLDHCIVGLSSNDKLVYSYSKLIEHFYQGDLSESIEHVCQNIVSIEGENTFLILYDYV